MSRIARLSFACALVVAVLGGVLPAAAVEAAAFPGVNGLIAFSAGRDGNQEIYVMNPDGSAQTRLTTVAGADQAPSWSADGTRIAFHSEREGSQQEIFSMNADGSAQTDLSQDNTNDDFEPAWGPDGRIAFVTNRDGDEEVYVMNGDGAAQTNLTEDSTGDDGFPAWSPDGGRIAFTTNRDGNREIYVMNADGSGPTNLTDDAADDFAPTWSPDGTRIAFNRGFEIYVMNADGSGQTNISNNPAIDLSAEWSPDGTSIAFHTLRDGGQTEMYVMGADGSNPVRLTTNTSPDFEAAWQPLAVPAPSVSNAKSKEGKPAKFKVMLPSASAQPVTYSFETQKGKAKPKKDFKPKAGTITFAPGETSKTIKVKTTNDNGEEKKETFTLIVTFPGGPSDTGKAKIKDND